MSARPSRAPGVAGPCSRARGTVEVVSALAMVTSLALLASSPQWGQKLWPFSTEAQAWWKRWEMFTSGWHSMKVPCAGTTNSLCKQTFTKHMSSDHVSHENSVQVASVNLQYSLIRAQRRKSPTTNICQRRMVNDVRVRHNENNYFKFLLIKLVLHDTESRRVLNEWKDLLTSKCQPGLTLKSEAQIRKVFSQDCQAQTKLCDLMYLWTYCVYKHIRWVTHSLQELHRSIKRPWGMSKGARENRKPQWLHWEMANASHAVSCVKASLTPKNWD